MTHSADTQQYQLSAVRGIILARWFVIFGLGILGLLQNVGRLAIVGLSLPVLLGLLGIPTVLNLWYTLLFWRTPFTMRAMAMRWWSFVQIIFDFIMITAVVVTTGGVESISFVLYVLPMLAVTMLASDIVIILFTLFGVALYASVIIAEYQGWFPHIARYHSDPGFFQNVEITLANTTSVVFIMLVAGMFFVFINRIIQDRTMTAMFERDKVRAILNSLEDGIILLDQRQNILFMNPPARTLLRLRTTRLPTLLSNERFSPVFRPLLHALADRSDHKQLGHDVALTEHQHSVTIRVDSIPLHNTHGAVVSWMKILRDVTREKELDEMKSDFISIAAHQLRTPLSALKWFFQLVIDGDIGKLSQEQEPLFRTASDRVNQIIEIVNNLLNISEIEEGRTAYTFAKEHMEPILTAVVENAVIAAKERKVTVRLELPRTSLPVFAMDKEKMRMAVQNVVDNAVKYSRPHTEVRVTSRVHDDAVEIVVQDSGIGIPSAEQSRIFEKFFRGSNAKEYEPTGSGLGMYIVRNIVHKHHGNVWLTSALQKGTTLVMRFPFPSKQHS